MRVRLILVLVLGRQTVYGQKTVYLCLSTYIVFENSHTLRVTNAASETGGRSCYLMDGVVDRVVRVTTAANETEGVAAVSWIESLMIRRPLGSIDPNSIRVSELHTECRRTVGRTWCGGEMSISNAMLLRFASGVLYGFRDRQRFELVPKITRAKM